MRYEPSSYGTAMRRPPGGQGCLIRLPDIVDIVDIVHPHPSEGMVPREPAQRDEGAPKLRPVAVEAAIQGAIS